MAKATKKSKMNIEKVIKTFEEFQVTLSNGKILVSKSEEELKRLEGLKKTEYEIYSKDTYEQIKALL